VVSPRAFPSRFIYLSSSFSSCYHTSHSINAHLQSLIALKSGLLDLVYGTARGVRANGEQRAGIEEHLTALEARNPNPRPTEVGPVPRQGMKGWSGSIHKLGWQYDKRWLIFRHTVILNLQCSLRVPGPESVLVDWTSSDIVHPCLC
jgi:hypothetical protein